MFILTDFVNKVAKQDLFALVAVTLAQSRVFLYPRKLPVSKTNRENRMTYNLYSIKYWELSVLLSLEMTFPNVRRKTKLSSDAGCADHT